MRRFMRSESGIAMALTLVMLPVFVLLAVVLIDVGRGNNAHSDLQAAADALALAGARELDGGVDAIERANRAMEKLTNSVSYLGQNETNDLGQKNTDALIALNYTPSGTDAFTVVFLDAIPDSDDEALDAAYLADHATTAGEEAEYVYVAAQSQDLTSIFGLNPDTPVGAVAVATYRTAACNVTPLFICNPFETQDLDLQVAFAEGQLHGRLLRLHPKGNNTAAPGNFGFLQVNGTNDNENDNTSASANTIRRVFAGDDNPTCYAAGRVTTKPGAAVSIGQGLNVRMDIYEGPFGNDADEYAPDVNVRKGYVRKINGASGKPSNDPCITELTTDLGWARPFPDNKLMEEPGQGVIGAKIGSGNWDIDAYWLANYRPMDLPDLSGFNSFPVAQGDGAQMPSRYDVYRYELSTRGSENDLVARHSTGSVVDATDAMEEVGLPICSQSKNGALPPEEGRRVIFAAIIDCLAEASGGATEMNVNSYASLFLTRPMSKSGAGGDGTIDVEIIDITGYGGNGSLDTFVRDEAVLVR